MFPSLVNKLKNKWLLPFHLFITEIYMSIKGGSIHMEAAKALQVYSGPRSWKYSAFADFAWTSKVA